MRINIYFAGWLRGPEGNKATYDSVMANVQRNLEWQKKAKSKLKELKEFKFVFYSPHEHEDIYQKIGHWAKQDTETRAELSNLILRQSLCIVDLCHVLASPDSPEFSGGLALEVSFADDKNRLVLPCWQGNDSFLLIDNFRAVWEAHDKQYLKMLELQEEIYDNL